MLCFGTSGCTYVVWGHLVLLSPSDSIFMHNKHEYNLLNPRTTPESSFSVNSDNTDSALIIPWLIFIYFRCQHCFVICFPQNSNHSKRVSCYYPLKLNSGEQLLIKLHYPSMIVQDLCKITDLLENSEIYLAYQYFLQLLKPML